MISEQAQDQQADQSPPRPAPAAATVVSLRPPGRWQDPLNLIQTAAPAPSGRIVLWTISVLMLLLLAWARFGELDVIVSAEGKLAPLSLVKVVQPAEAGVLKQLLVSEGDAVKKGQLLARLDTTLAHADVAGVSIDLASRKLQLRRVEAELANAPLRRLPDDDPRRFAHENEAYEANRKAFRDILEQEKSLLVKAEQEMRSALQIEQKLAQTLPHYAKAATAYANLEREGFFSSLAADEKRREATEKERDLAAQKSTVAALAANVLAQQQRLLQLRSAHDSNLQKELSELRNRIRQLQPALDKASYQEGLMELKAPQDGVIVDLATTTIGAVVKPGDVLLTLVPKGERLAAIVNIRNEDVGFVAMNQAVQIKLAAYPFQKYGMLHGTVTQVGADVTMASLPGASGIGAAGMDAGERKPALLPTYKARVAVTDQFLTSPAGERLQLSPGMQITAEIRQGTRSVLDYLLSPVKKVVQEAGRER